MKELIDFFARYIDSDSFQKESLPIIEEKLIDPLQKYMRRKFSIVIYYAQLLLFLQCMTMIVAFIILWIARRK